MWSRRKTEAGRSALPGAIEKLRGLRPSGRPAAAYQPAQFPTFTGELPPANLDGYFRRSPLGRVQFVAPAEAAERMGRTVEEIEKLARAGVLECHIYEGRVEKVRPILLGGPR